MHSEIAKIKCKEIFNIESSGKYYFYRQRKCITEVNDPIRLVAFNREPGAQKNSPSVETEGL